MKNFIQQVKDGNVKIEQIDEFVDQWHNGTSPLELHEFLGMTKDEYSLWVTHPQYLEDIVKKKAV